MKKVILFVIITVTGCFSVQGSTDEIKEKLVLEYIKLTKIEDIFSSTIEVYVQQRVSANPSINADQLGSFHNQFIGWEVLKEPIIKIVSDLLTKEELIAVNNFYKTKHGISYANKTHALNTSLADFIAKKINQARPSSQTK